MPQPLPPCFSLQQFSDDVRRTVVTTDVKYRDHVGMIQSCGGLSLEFEAAKSLRIARPVLGQDFDRHVPLQGNVARAIDLTHSARAKWGDDLKRIQPSARG